MGWGAWIVGAVAATLAVAPAGAQVSAVAQASAQLPADALAQDGQALADHLAIPAADASRQIVLDEASVAVTDAIADRYAGRLAGIAIDHQPGFAITVLLTGDAPVPDDLVDVAGTPVPVRFRTGAPASRTEIVQAIASFQATIRASLLVPPGLGLDQRTGELVALVSTRDVAREGAGPLHDRLATLTGIPVRLRAVDDPSLDMAAVEGGARLLGSVPDDPRRFVCTAGFVVTDGSRSGIATAAHCPDTLSARAADGHDETLAFVGQWGRGNQDVQINASAEPLPATVLADTAGRVSRSISGARPRAGMRAGDIVCHRGVRTGFSCSTVELTDFAPAGDLCGGACLPTWTTVAGPGCKGGDSGSPVFLGGVAYGILKGGSYRADGSCAFYFYMSLDYLPQGWRLETNADPPPIAATTTPVSQAPPATGLTSSAPTAGLVPPGRPIYSPAAAGASSEPKLILARP